MDFNSADLTLILVGVVVVMLLRTLFLASKQINSSDKFPKNKNFKDNEKDKSDST